MARGWQGRESSATIVRSIDRKFADRRTDSFTCHGAMCIGAKRPVSSFSPPSVFHLSLPRRSLDFSNLRDAIPPSIRSRLASLDFVQGGHLLRSLFPPPANHVFLACQGIVSSLRRGERLVSNLENTKLNRRRSLSLFLSLSFILQSSYEIC